MAVAAYYRIPHSELLSWSDDDRAKAMWQYARERATCDGCGTRPEEWVGPDGPRLDAYEAHARLCHGCRAISHHREQQGENPPAGLQIALRKPKPKEVARGEQT